MPGLEDQDEFSTGEYPHLNDLPPEQQTILKAVKSPADIRECMVMDSWYDDHQLCVGVALNGVEFGAWWIGWQLGGAMFFSDSAKAGPMIVDYLQKQFDYLDKLAEVSRLPEDPDEITQEDLPQ